MPYYFTLIFTITTLIKKSRKQLGLEQSELPPYFNALYYVKTCIFMRIKV